MPNPKVCILVLNWNGASDTIECLDSLKKLTYTNSVSIVIDNGSDDDSVTHIKRAHPQIETLALPENLLYGGGNNAGFDWIVDKKYDFVVFLNNDTIVEADFLEPLLQAFNEDDKIGMAAPLMCYADRPDEIWYGGGLVNLWTGRVAHRNIRESVSVLKSEPTSTEYITGCCLMIPTNLVREIGGFNPAFKMYGEDVDLSLRYRNAGYKLAFVPQSKIYHKVSASLGGEFSLSKLKRKLVGMLQIYVRHARWYQWLLIIPSQLVLSIVYFSTFIRHRKKDSGFA